MKYSENEAKVASIEKKYMQILHKIFSSEIFSQYINASINSIQDATEEDSWEKTNPIDLCFQRLIHYMIYQKLNSEIMKPYPSPISSDVAVVLKDAVLNIDAKTVSEESNKGDFKQLQVSNNQISFDNKPVEGWDYKSYLSKTYEKKPVLSYFLTLRYTQNKIGSKEGFRLMNSKTNSDLTLSCVPNGILSDSLNRDLIYGFKTYEKLSLSRQETLSVKEHTIGNEKQYGRLDQNDNKFKVKPILEEKLGKGFINSLRWVKSGKGKGFCYKDDSKGVQYKLKRLKGGHLTFDPSEPSSARIRFEKLENRLDAFNKSWSGHLEWNIKGN